jgi:hypothetical protein
MQRTGRKHIQSKDLSQTKVTPRTRQVHEARNSGQLIKPDLNRKYVLASKDEAHPMNYMSYESMGYELELCKKDGVRILEGTKTVDGKPLEWRGMALMSCSLERAEEIFLKGPTGNTGQEYQDKIMRKIKGGELEQRTRIAGLEESYDISDLQQNPVFRD